MRILATWLAFQLYSSTVTATDQTIVGRQSSSRDDAESRATCPQGYAVTHCEVKSGQVNTKSDGAFVDPSNGRVCVAVNGGGGPGAVALAKCSEDGQIPDSCDLHNLLLPKFITLHSRGAHPTVSCPPGYEQTVCNARSPWLGLLQNKGVNSKGVIPNGKTCAVPNCSHKNWCEVTAVCKILEDPGEYMDAVCPVIIPVEGSPSRIRDDALSIASCPMGYVASHCEVKSGLVNTRSDGAFVDPSSEGGVCVAVHAGHGGPAAVALAKCSRNIPVPDPCKQGPGLPKFISLHSKGPYPRVSCPRGYQQTVCNARSPWLGLLRSKGVNPKGIIPNGKRCAVPNCSQRNWCEVTAVCKIMNSEAYKNAVCPRT